MNVVTDIFAEYVNKRQNGLTRDETLDILRNYIRELPKPERQELASYVRTWEAKLVSTADAELPDVTRTSTLRLSEVIAKAKNKTPGEYEQVKVRDTGTLPQIQATSENKVKCTNCGKFNNTGAMICFACGFMLDDAAKKFGTQQLKDAAKRKAEYQRFGKMSTLVLTIQDTSHEFEIRPQLFPHEIIVGRSTKGSSVVPDVDLADYGGDRLGVSRLHLAIKYEHRDDAIQIYDLESSNGTTLNGEPMHPREVRVLRDGDEIRLGHLALTVTFQQRSARAR